MVSAHNLREVKWVVGVAAGKGGVGKSTVAVNTAYALHRLGLSVGILDADVYGPSLCKMLTCRILPKQSECDPQRIIPADCLGMKMISLAHFRKEGEAVIVRAPIASGVIEQFIHKVEWGGLDVLVVDFPPGTGDIQLSLLQQSNLSGAIVVTTPQEIALLDVRKCIQMFEQLQIAVIGIIENMSYFVASDGVKTFPFGRGGGRALADAKGLPFLEEIPLDPCLSASGDKGIPLLLEAPESEAGIAFKAIALALRTYLLEREKGCEKNFHLVWDSSEGETPCKMGDQLVRKKPLSTEALSVRSIDKVGVGGFSIEWSDGRKSLYRLSEVQKNCPCAQCAEKEERESEESICALRLESVGQYALKIQFSSGCSKGIYPFSLLRQIG